MPVTAVVGANWGDEGKGKIVDYLAEKADYVVRFQGGNNAGHTIINDFGKFALHLLPSGICHSHIVNVLGPGVAINCEGLLKELTQLENRKVPTPQLKISDRAQIVLPYHILFDEYEEERRGKESFGSTKSGMAPFYGDKFLKIGIQINEIFDKETVKARLTQALTQKNVLIEHLYKKELQNISHITIYLQSVAEKIEQYLADTTVLLNQALKEEKNILLEGQLGSLRDPDHGIYPYSTSSSPLAGYAPVGSGLPAHAIKNIVVITKAYSTCVGAGPFVVELDGDEAEELRKRGGDAGEYGATTGRPRRVGWFDCVATRYGAMVQGATGAVVTNMDVLGYLDTIKLCTGYKINGEIRKDFPVTRLQNQAMPVFKEMPGWKRDISDVREMDDLPQEAKDYIKFIEDEIETPVVMVSNGPRREQIIIR